MSDMYRCMLNKQRDVPGAIRVPLEEYKGAMTKYVHSICVSHVEPESEPAASFVLFHADLVRACRDRGVITNSDPCEMWSIVLRHSEVWSEDADDDSDKFADQR